MICYEAEACYSTYPHIARFPVFVCMCVCVYVNCACVHVFIYVGRYMSCFVYMNAFIMSSYVYVFEYLHLRVAGRASCDT